MSHETQQLRAPRDHCRITALRRHDEHLIVESLVATPECEPAAIRRPANVAVAADRSVKRLRAQRSRAIRTQHCELEAFVHETYRRERMAIPTQIGAGSRLREPPRRSAKRGDLGERPDSAAALDSVKKITALESGVQRGSVLSVAPCVSCSGEPPLSRRTQTCRTPLTRPTNATDLPSGESAGESCMPTKSVRRPIVMFVGRGASRGERHDNAPRRMADASTSAPPANQATCQRRRPRAVAHRRRRSALRFVAARVADVAEPGFAQSFARQRRSSSRNARRDRGRQQAPVGLVLDDRSERVGHRVARERAVAR